MTFQEWSGGTPHVPLFVVADVSTFIEAFLRMANGFIYGIHRVINLLSN